MSEDIKKKKSLGRGLEALLGEMNEDVLNNELNQVKLGDVALINDIYVSPFQPRKDFDEDAIKSLASSIKEKGVLQPLIVRKTDKGLELIAGERRLRASKIAGLTEVPVIIKDFSDGEVLEIALVENLLRENLSAIEEAEAYQKLMVDFSHTQEKVASIVGKSRSYIANTLRLLTLSDDIKSYITNGKLTAGHARCLVGLENANFLAEKIIKEELSVRQVEEIVSKQKETKTQPVDKDEKNAKKVVNRDISDIERKLKEKLGLRIKISQNKQGGGKVVLQYASTAELDMIINVLDQKKQVDLGIKNNVFKDDEVQQQTKNDKFSIKFIE
ncbi:MAG: ParB/RepB/Spo0J family partition protein [Alphaproteobacteria bacterium]|nr:ParB/RepB/Spo0J family partition protein [Alphaproteobacteria bacterium]